MLCQAAELGKGENEGDDRNDEEERLAQDEEQNSRTENGRHQQINQNRQSKIHGCYYKGLSVRRKAVTNSPALGNIEPGCLPAQVPRSHVKTPPDVNEITEARGHFY